MNLIRATVFISALFTLSACSLFSAPITNPLGLDEKEIEVTVDGPPEIRVQVASSATGGASASLNDSSSATGTLTNTVTFEATVVVAKGTGNTNAYPGTITIENVVVAVSIDDGTTDSVSDSASITTAFTMTRDDACASTAAPCSYTMTVPAGVSISLPIGTVLNNGAEPNAVAATITLALESTPGLEGGDTLLFILEAEEGSGSL